MGSAASRSAFDVDPGASGALFAFVDPLEFRDSEDSAAKGDEDSAVLGKTDSSIAFTEVVSLITGFFPDAKPSGSAKVDPSSWFCDFGSARQCNLHVFLSLFDKLALVKSDIEEKFFKAVDDRKKVTSSLLTWGDIYRLGDLSGFHKATKVNKSVYRLLDKPVASSWYVSLFLDECAKLKSCIRGFIKSQSFSFWALATVFAFLKDSGCEPECDIFHRLVTSLTVLLNSQAKAAFSATSFMKQKCRETLVLHLLVVTHASVKHALVTTPSSDTLFAEEVIRDSLTQVREDSQLTLLKNLSFGKGGKGFTLSTSTSGQRRSALSSSVPSSSSARTSAESSGF